MRALALLVAVLAPACSSADSQTNPAGTNLTRIVLTGFSAPDGSAMVTLPSAAGSAAQLPVVAVYALDPTKNQWSAVSDGDGTFDGNGSWLIEAPSSGPLLVRMRQLGSRAEGGLGSVSYQVVVIY